jgi:hypothetical protein
MTWWQRIAIPSFYILTYGLMNSKSVFDRNGNWTQLLVFGFLHWIGASLDVAHVNKNSRIIPYITNGINIIQYII